MKICIGGLTASGKTTLGEVIAEELNIAHISKLATKSYRDFHTKKLSKKQQLTETHRACNVRHANSFDTEIAKMAQRTDCVVTTWLGPWMVKNPTLRVWLNAGIEERTARYAKRHKMPAKAARAYILEKDKETISGFKKVYGINIMDRSNFDMEINTARIGIKDSASLIAMLALLREKRKETFR
jgi:predicted cytidylate kinase